MTGTVSPTVPTLGDPNATEDPDIRTSLIVLRDALNAVLDSTNKLDGAKLGAGTVTSAALANNSVTSAKIVDGTIAAADLGTDSVTTAKIAADAVTYVELADLSVVAANIWPAQIDNSKLNLTRRLGTAAATHFLTTGWTTEYTISSVTPGYYLMFASIAIDASTEGGHVAARFNIDGGDGTPYAFRYVTPPDFATGVYIGHVDSSIVLEATHSGATFAAVTTSSSSLVAIQIGFS